MPINQRERIVMWKCLTVASFCVVALQTRAEPEVKGSPAELTAYLAGVPKLVSISGEAELKLPADRALISLKVVTENKSLQEASRANPAVLDTLLLPVSEHV